MRQVAVDPSVLTSQCADIAAALGSAPPHLLTLQHVMCTMRPASHDLP
jgi:hypothetical protein